ncbi:MAG TPA: HEAT repeat domain-containing protein [Gemmataceae bacterium]|nr:HEAT repeat domain-containing protein [Gemmataceae bacterium]
MHNSSRFLRAPRRAWGWRLACAGLINLGFCGCAGFWDDVTSHDFEVNSLFVKPNPLVVLKDSTDGDKRARALRSFREPVQYGDPEMQDTVVNLLTAAAVSEHQYFCRLAAIQSLGHFKDPRAVKALEEAYYKADAEYREGKFPLDAASAIQCQAIRSLGQTENPAAVNILVRIVGEARLEGAEKDQQQAMDKRIAAARALGNFTSYQATESLVKVLQSEKDVALRDSAHESLKKITKKDLPPDYQNWNDLLHESNGKDFAIEDKRGPLDKVLEWFGSGN